MTEREIENHLTTHFEGVEVEISDGNHFFFHGPDHKFPFATLVTGDAYDQVSNLSREGVFRLNIGISRETFVGLFGTRPSGEEPVAAHDFTALDQLMPHPVYGSMFWVCILSPSEENFQKSVNPLLEEAFRRAVGK